MATGYCAPPVENRSSEVYYAILGQAEPRQDLLAERVNRFETIAPPHVPIDSPVSRCRRRITRFLRVRLSPAPFRVLKRQTDLEERAEYGPGHTYRHWRV